LETLKVGGSENMQMAEQLYTADAYKQQQKTTLEQILGQMWTAGTPAWTTDTATQPTTAQPAAEGTALTDGDKTKFASIEKDGYILGNKDARITIIEYSDMLCPFCKRHYNAQTLENLIKKYPNDVNMVFRQMPLPQLHPTAPIWAQGAVCVGKLGGADKFYAYLAVAFQASEFTETNVTDMAVNLGIDKAKFTSCFSSAETIATVNAQVQEGQGFGINGTPWNVIVDNQNGKYSILAGAYPTENFEAVIKSILGK